MSLGRGFSLSSGSRRFTGPWGEAEAPPLSPPRTILPGPAREYSPEMISSPWLLLLVGAAGASATMVVVWLVSIRIANASYVDVAWALGIAGTAVAYALLADGSTLHRVLVAGLGTIWGVRLGTYLLARLAGKEED